VLAALGPLLMLGGGLAWGLDVSDELPFFGISAAIALVGAFFVWRFGIWGKVVGIVAAVLVAMALFWTAFGLASPDSFFDFVPGLLVVPGVLLAVASSVGAIVAHRRGHHTRFAERGERTGIRITVAAAIGLAILSGILTVAARSSVEEADVALTVKMSDFEFERAPYTVSGGERVLVSNNDPFVHTFTVDELGIDVALGPGSEEIVDIPAESGSYILYCKPHTQDPDDPGEDDMAARLEVE
jgi:plastocyanin